MVYIRRQKMPASPIRGGEWNSQLEFRAAAYIRLYVDAAVVQLKNAVRHGKANAAALIGNTQDRRLQSRQSWAVAVGRPPAFFFEGDLQGPTRGHGLGAVLNHVERRLLEQIGIDVGYQRLRWHFAQ